MAFIRKKRKGITAYYELVKSMRTKQGVRQKVIEYLGGHDEMLAYCKRHKLKPPKEEPLFDKATAGMIEKKLDRLNKFRPLPEKVLVELKKKFEIEMTYNSNAIEGNRLTLRETYLVLERGMTIGGKSVREHLEAINHKEAIHFLETLTKKKKITMNDVLQLHAIIVAKALPPNEAGFFRRHRIFIAGSTHKPPGWKDVPKLMEKVVKELNSKDKGIEAVESSVNIHYMVAWIHAFTDGNGRLARLLSNLRLMRAGFPPIILKKRIRKTYYNSLDRADGGNLKQLARITARDLVQSLDLYLNAIRET